MTDSYSRELREIIDRTFTEKYAGRASAQMVQARVQDDLPEHLIGFLIGKGVRSRVTAYFGEKNPDGLPKRPAVNPVDEHADLALLTVEECGYVYNRYIDLSDANREQAEKVRQLCIDMHGVDLSDEAAA